MFYRNLPLIRRVFIILAVNAYAMTARILLLLFLLSCRQPSIQAEVPTLVDATPERITVPIGGNTFLTSAGDKDQVTSAGIQEWKSTESVLSTFVHFLNPKKAVMFLELEEQAEESEMIVSVGSYNNRMILRKGTTIIEVGTLAFSAGYNQITFKGVNRGKSNFAVLKAIHLDPLEKNFGPSFVKDNIDNRFYWGRRGPSVHLSYQMPDEEDYQWFYSEVTVPVGEDPEGSYLYGQWFCRGILWYSGQLCNGKARVVLRVEPIPYG